MIEAFVLSVALDEVALPGGGRLRWIAEGAGCPSAQAIADGLVARTGASIDATAIARTTAQGWTVEIDLVIEAGPTSRRTVEVADCRAAAEAVVLAITLATVPSDADTTTSPEIPEPTAPAPVPPPAPRAAPPDAARPPATPASPPRTLPDRDRRARALVGIGAGIAGGVEPRLAALVLASVGLQLPRFRLVLRHEARLARSVALPSRAGAGGRVGFYGGALELGPRFELGPIELLPTVAVAAAGVHAQGFGSDRDRTAWVGWAGAIAGVGLAWAPAGWWAIGLRGDAVFSLVQRRFGFGPDLPLVATGWIGGRASAFFEIRLPR